MPSKQAIIENVEMYSANELVDFIKQGVVTFQELCDDTEGQFSANVRKEVEKIINGSEEDDWLTAKNCHSIEILERYLSTYEKGSHREEARNLISQFEKEREDAAASGAWDKVDKNSENDLKEFCYKYPQNSHCLDAKKLINKLQKERFLGRGVKTLVNEIKKIQANKDVIDKNGEIYNTIVNYYERNKINHADLLSMIKTDNNILRASVINLLLENGYLEYEDFTKIGIEEEFVEYLANGVRSQGTDIPEKLERINKKSTEVYFWGIPSSGKSCALGAILSVANNGKLAKTMRKDIDCQGFGYMTRLSALFKTDDKVCTLPEGTSIYSTYEMGFDLIDEKNYSHPITCVDLAGELIRCMYKNGAREKLSDDEMSSLDTLTNILIGNRSVNRKIHFFVIEYGAEDRQYEGLEQTEYLEAALRYIERTKIFEKETDAIYLMITKVDKAKAEKGQLKNVLSSYISNNYAGFYNGLVQICSDCEINGGKVEVIPFSLGKVCFQDYCLFDEKPASNVVRKLLERSKGFKKGKFQRIINGLEE